jgi:putative ABC transport system substrate-binding protein
MRRREFVTLLGGAVAAWPLAARAQQPDRMRRIGIFVGIAKDAEGLARVVAFRDGLQALGWVEGRNVQFDERWAAGDAQLMRPFAKELIALNPDVILVAANPALAALREETRTVPIVFAQVADPIGAGFVASAAKPGGNITGFSHIEFTIVGKWLELLKEIAPSLKRVAALGNPTDFTWPAFVRTIADVAPSLGLQVTPTGVRNVDEIERAIDAFAREPDGGLVNVPTPTTAVHRDVIIRKAAQHRLPVVFHLRFFAAEGGLMSYGVNNIELFRRAASYVDRVLRGANPGDLPVQFPTKYELVINLKTAKAMGLTVPEAFLLRADEVIE